MVQKTHEIRTLDGARKFSVLRVVCLMDWMVWSVTMQFTVVVGSVVWTLVYSVCLCVLL